MTVQIQVHGYADGGFDIYSISKNFTRVGHGSSNDLALNVDGIPEQALLLERMEGSDALKVHVKASQLIILNKSLLEVGNDAVWKPGENMEVGDLTLFLEVKTQEDPVSFNPVVPTLKKKKALDEKNKAEKLNSEEGGEEEEQEGSGVDLMKIIQIAITIVLFIGAIVLFLIINNTGRKQNSSSRMNFQQLEYYISNNRDFDSDFLKRFREAHARETVSPQTVGYDYYYLQQIVREVIQDDIKNQNEKVKQLQNEIRGNIELKERHEEMIADIKANSFMSFENKALLTYINDKIRSFPIK